MRILRYILLIPLLMQISFAYGVSLPSYYPTSFIKSGAIDEININRQTIIIDDELYNIDSSLLVHTPSNQQVNSYKVLTKGTNVGAVNIVNGKIFELWILPVNYDSDIDDQ